MKKTCKFCNEEFETDKKQQRYCSEKHRQANANYLARINDKKKTWAKEHRKSKRGKQTLLEYYARVLRDNGYTVNKSNTMEV